MPGARGGVDHGGELVVPPAQPGAAPRSGYGRPVPSADRPRVVVFDLGGVLVSADGLLDDLAGHLGAPVEALGAAYWRVRDDYDRGGPAPAFWGAVGRELGLDLGPGDVDRLDDVDTARWSVPTPPARQLLEDLAAGGTPLAVLSNAPRSLAARVRAAEWSGVFSTLVFSSEVGVLKPDAAVYRAAEEAIGARGDDVTFFDDRQVNVDGALACGWRAHLWTGTADARRLLGPTGVTGG